MPVNATTPTTPPPINTFDKWWINLSVIPPHPDLPMTATVTMRRYGTGTDGRNYFDPSSSPVAFQVDLTSEMEANDTVAAAFVQVLTAVESVAHVRGLL